MSEQNREKEERLFRALSGVEEELLHRSEQNEGVEKRKANGKIRRFSLYYVSRIAAACLCFVVVGVLYVTMSSTKMADSTGADTAAPQSAYSAGADGAAPAEDFEAAKAGDTAEEAETAGPDGAGPGPRPAAQPHDRMAETQRRPPAGSGTAASGAEDSMEEAEQDQEETLIEKQKSPSLEKMKRKGQQ